MHNKAKNAFVNESMKIVIFIRTNNEDAYNTVMHDAAKANPKVIRVRYTM